MRGRDPLAAEMLRSLKTAYFQKSWEVLVLIRRYAGGKRTYAWVWKGVALVVNPYRAQLCTRLHAWEQERSVGAVQWLINLAKRGSLGTSQAVCCLVCCAGKCFSCWITKPGIRNNAVQSTVESVTLVENLLVDCGPHGNRNEG